MSTAKATAEADAGLPGASSCGGSGYLFLSSFLFSAKCDAKWVGQGGGTPRFWVEVPPLVTSVLGHYCLPTICYALHGVADGE